MKKPIAAITIGAATLGGVATGATILGPGIAGAQDDATETQQFESFSERVAAALQPLVNDGTIDAAQRDAVVAQLEASRPDPGEHGRRGPGRRGPHRPAFGADIAEILGLERADIGEALRQGDSLADLATANGVDPQDLVDAIVAATEERVNGALELGRIDAERAEDMLADAEQRAEDIVNGELELHGRRFGGPGGGFGGGPAGGDTDPSA